ncbi:unnamed protein product [Phytophthora fragariaefolia]|uniref:Unnamed protein product n=1 Tax=Phytophthora fragariaefolia TaxID=1490495 RepID=A0A9W7D2V7_9STRA|nr:unnamed protein product [Phytophthora fragariaefolia]
MDPDDVSTDGLLASPLLRRSRDPEHLANDRKAKVCRELLRSRLVEAKLEYIAKYSVKLLNEHDELATVLANEKEETARLAATLGIVLSDEMVGHLNLHRGTVWTDAIAMFDQGAVWMDMTYFLHEQRDHPTVLNNGSTIRILDPRPSDNVCAISATVSTTGRNGAGEGSLGEHGYGAARGRGAARCRGVPCHEGLPMPNALASGRACEDTDRPIEATARTTGVTTTATGREAFNNAFWSGS